MPTSKRRSSIKHFAKKTRRQARQIFERRREKSLRELREALYLFKILDSFWFEGDLPDNLVKPFTVLTNPDWPEPSPILESPGGLQNLSESEMCFIAWQLKKPAWARRPDIDRSTYTMNDLLIISGEKNLLVDSSRPSSAR